MHRLIALDVDGTLVDRSGCVSPKVHAAIKRVRDMGMYVTIISGRTRASLRDVIAQLELEIPYAGSNGAFIAHPQEPELLSHFPFPAIDAEQIVELAIQEKASGICFQHVDQVYFDEDGYQWITAVSPRWVRFATAIQLNQMTSTVPCPSKIDLMGEIETMESIVRRIHEELPSINVVSGVDPRYLELNAAGVDKGSALKKVCEMLDIPLSEAIACGDGQNDVSMIRKAGLGVAMGNALPDVKAAADWVAPTVENDGLAWVLEQVANNE